jgi:ribose transport system permease protein
MPVNLANVFRQVSMTGLVAIGMTFVILSGGIDLSVGSTAAAASVLAAILSGSSGLVAILAPILLGVLIGAANGVLITRVKIPPFIATLAMMLGGRGVAFIMAGGKPVAVDDSSWLPSIARTDLVGWACFGIVFLLVFGITASVAMGLEVKRKRVPVYIISGVLAVAVSMLLAFWAKVVIPGLGIVFLVTLGAAILVAGYTSFGRSLYAIGGNEEAAAMMGLNVKRKKLLVYMICGGLAGAAGVLLTSRINSGQPSAAAGWELIAIAAVVIGVTSLTGGRGKMSHTLYGVLILGVIPNVINLQGTLPYWYANLITGILLLAVVLLQSRIAGGRARTT